MNRIMSHKGYILKLCVRENTLTFKYQFMVTEHRYASPGKSVSFQDTIFSVSLMLITFFSIFACCPTEVFISLTRDLIWIFFLGLYLGTGGVTVLDGRLGSDTGADMGPSHSVFSLFPSSACIHCLRHASE